MNFPVAQFADINEFLGMGGHGVYVWLAYGATLLVLAGNLVLPVLRQRGFVDAEQRRMRRASSGNRPSEEAQR